MKIFNRFLLWPLLLTGHFLAMCLLSWHLLAQINFAYPLGYKLLDIEQHIKVFGPENRYKKYFERTTTEEQMTLFEEIVTAVQNRGDGLAQINYTLPDGNHEPLMRTPEVIHLQDVANLIDLLYWAGLGGGLLWLLLGLIAVKQKFAFPSLKKILLGFILCLSAIAAVTLVIGPTAVFYWLHVQIFPEEHEWFFFYQDSLMTTLMKAPDLFGFIAVLLVLVFVVIWSLSIWGMTKILKPEAKLLSTQHSNSNPNPNPNLKEKNNPNKSKKNRAKSKTRI